MSRENQFQRIAQRYHQKLSDLAILKMHLIRDEQETLNQLLDEFADLLSEETQDSDSTTKIEDLFKGPSYKIRYKLNDMLEDND